MTTVAPSYPQEILKNNILKNIGDITKGVKNVLNELGIDPADPLYGNMFNMLYTDARITFNDTVFNVTGQHQ